MIFILYLFGILGLLGIGIYAVISIGLICIPFCGYSIYRNKQNFIASILTPGFAIFIIFFVLSWWAQRGRLLTNWDEFSHWGTVVKNMYIFDALGTHPDATTIFKGYPPATALFQYLWVKLHGTFSEDNLYTSMNILYFSLMIPIFKNTKWNQFGKIAIRTILILILPLVFYQDFYVSILVDGILAIMFAYILYNYYGNKMSTFKMLNVSLALFVLTITKASGSGLAFIAVLAIAIDLLFVNRYELKQYIKQDKKINTFKRVVVVLSPILFTLLSKYSWALHLKLTKTNTAWDTSTITLKSFKSLFNGTALPFRTLTIKNFFHALTDSYLTVYTFKIPFIVWIALLALISFILINYVCNKEEKYRFKVATITIFVGAAIYTFSLLILYVFTYSEAEAIRLASYSRYIGTYLLGILVFLVVIICLKEEVDDTKSKLSFSTAILLSLFVITGVTPIFDITLWARSNINASLISRANYEPITKIKQIVNPKTDKVYFISINNNGYDYWVSCFDITPIKTNQGFAVASWSLGKPYYDIDANKWGEELRREYTYVYIFKTNDSFNKNYGALFDGGSKSIQMNTLYYVNKSNGKIVLQKAIYR